MKFVLASTRFPPTRLIGGIVESSYRISTALSDLGHEVTVVCTDAGQKSDELDRSTLKEIKQSKLTIVLCRSFFSEFYGVTLDLYKIFLTIKNRPDALIANELFSFLTIASMVFACLFRVPYVLFPRGALMPNVFKGSKKKKYFMTILAGF